ncbi:MAG: 50S ribosomal protein L35 [Candidatus Omnitrophota bacterium]|nr:MAG: 50S ribosomal protein L35 [Candidatus Omnitrophota bacterium]
MPKLKTNKGTAKRFKITGGKKVKRSQANKGHLKKSKNMKRKRRLRRPAMASGAEEKMLKTLLPYS